MKKHRIKVALMLAAMKLLACCPLWFIQGLGACVGTLFSFFPTQFKRVAEKNIAICFPEMSPAWQRSMVRQSLRNTVMTAFEYAMHWFWPAEKVRSVIQEPDEDVQKAFYAAQGEGNGVIILSPHMGAWESMLGFLPGRMHVTMMYRPLRIQALESLVRSARERAGARLVPTTGSGIRAMLKALKHNEVVAMLPDQVPGVSGGVLVPFFNEPARTMTLAAKFAQKTGAKVMVGYVERLGFGQGFKPHAVLVGDEIYNPDLSIAATAMNKALEEAIRQHPEQYVWGYKRFKRRGSDLPKVY